jgi:hypothetical protein
MAGELRKLIQVYGVNTLEFYLYCNAFQCNYLYWSRYFLPQLIDHFVIHAYPLEIQFAPKQDIVLF